MKLRTVLAATLAFALLSVQKTTAQETPHFNHTTIYVVDLEKATEFYAKVMMLQPIPEPFHDNRHNWFKVADHSELHVVKGSKAIMPHDINIHLAFSVKDVAAFAKHLDNMGVKYGNWAQTNKGPEIRPDGVKQIYFQDPDGYWIEVDDDKF